MTEMTQSEAVRLAWMAAEEARRMMNDALYAEAAHLVGLSRAYSAIATQLPYVEPQAAEGPPRVPPPATMFGYVRGSGIKPGPATLAAARAFLADIDANPRPAPVEAVEMCQEIIAMSEPASEALLLPRPLERRDPTNVRTSAEIEHEAAQAALRGEPVRDPRAADTAVIPITRPTAVPRPGSIEEGQASLPSAICMCGLHIWLDSNGWEHAHGGPVCPS